MSGVGTRPLSLVEVARLLFRTAHPSDQQIGRVFERMRAGALRVHQRGASPRDWTTTEESLAEFMANEMLKRQNAVARPAPVKPRAPTRAGNGSKRTERATAADSVRGVYRGIWRDYFLAVMLRRRIAHRSVSFHRAVLAGQVAVLLSILGLILGVSRSFQGTPAERIAVKHYLAGQTDSFHIERWYPSQPDESGAGLLVEVEYRYKKDSHRAIHTRRTFRVSGDEVSEVADE